jgi:hypothetical protein
MIIRFTILGFLICNFACAPQTSSKEKEQIRNKNTESMSENGGEVGIDDGSNISLPPGAVAAGTEVTMQKVADDPAFAVGSESASSTVEIRALGQDGLPIEQASQSMTVALAIESGSGLSLADGKADDMCVLLKTLSGKQLIWRRSLLTIDDAGKKVSLQSLFFGKYKAIYCGGNAVTGFEEADTAGAIGGEQVAFAMTVKSDAFPDTVHSKYCYVVARMKDEALCEKDEVSNSDCEEFVVLATTEAAKSTASVVLSASINESLITDGYEYVTALVLLAAATDTCELKVGKNLKKEGFGLAQALFAYAFTKADVQSGISGIIGAGEFYNLDKVTVELGSFPNQAAFDESAVCVDVDGEKSKSMHSVAFSGGKIGTNAQRTFQAALPTGTKIETLTMHVGADCKTFDSDFATADLTSGKPYDFQTPLAAGQTIVAKPVKLKIERSDTSALAGKNGCVSVFIPDAKNDKSRLGKIAISFDQPSYDIFLPNLSADLHQFSGDPRYDMEVVVLNAGATCATSDLVASQFMTPIVIEDKPLTETIVIVLP